MKLLFVTREHQHERRYGLGKSLGPVVEALAARGHQVRYLCQADLGPRSRVLQATFNATLNRVGHLLPGRTRHADVLGAVFERYAMARLAASVARSERFDIVHAHDPVIGYWLSRRMRTRELPRWGLTQHGFGAFAANLTAHQIAVGEHTGRRLTRIERSAATRAHWVLFPSRSALERMAIDAALAQAPATWHVVPHPRPAVRCLDRARARAELGWQPDTLYVIGVGQLVPVKQFDLLVEACAKLATRLPLRLCLLGEGDSAGLHALAARNGLGERLEISVTDDVGLYLSAADLYVSTSASESFGIANLEALCAGCPAICTAVGSVPEVVGDGAWLIPPDDAAALHNAMQALLGDADAREQLAARGLGRAQSWPQAAEIAENHEKIYREALGESHRRLAAVPAP